VTLVALPIGGHWTLRVLKPADRDSVLTMLRRHPMANIYLISRVLEEGLRDGSTVGITFDSELISVASLTSNIVMTIDPSTSEEVWQAAVALVADRIVSRGVGVRAIISEERVVDELWRHLRARFHPPTVVRLTQPVYVLSGMWGDFPPSLQEVRYAEASDLEALVPACAAMHSEEVGIDPLQRDAGGYRERIRELVLRRRALVLMREGQIAFKTEYSAVTPEGVQLMGVWTAPEYRRQGLARQGLKEICGHLLHEEREVTLFVNDFNGGAIALYESLGFRRIGQNRALIW
jgi:predicted GNAT family acetyltransferase